MKSRCCECCGSTSAALYDVSAAAREYTWLCNDCIVELFNVISIDVRDNNAQHAAEPVVRGEHHE
ncbi:MAG: hypothetical protein HZC28_04450 [Spirochaetes bacterium]|nr:hypothetical protein [Spirochaetota bacterium]